MSTCKIISKPGENVVSRVMDDTLCPLCGRKALMQYERGRDWCEISCVNPRCLSPSTGWMSESCARNVWKTMFINDEVE